MVAEPMPLAQRTLWIGSVFVSGALAAVAHITTRHGLLIPESLGLAAANTVWLTTVLSPHKPRFDARVVFTLALMAGLGMAINLAYGLDLPQTLRMAVGNTLFPLMVLGLRKVQQPRLREWVVNGSADLFSLLSATVLASLLILLIGATPGVYLGGSATPLECLWWAARNTAYVFIALASIPIVWRADLIKELLRVPSDAVIATVLFWIATLSVWAVFRFPEYAITFLPLLPMIAAGMALRVLSCASVTGLTGVVASLFCSLPFFECNYDSVLPMPIALDLLIVCCALTAFYLSFTRHQRDHYSDELEMKSAELEAANRFMQHVQNSMDEGVVVFDPAGLSTIHNRSAAQLLGVSANTEALPASSWFDDVRTLDGSPLPDAFIRGPRHRDEGTYLLARGSTIDPQVLEVHLGALDPFSAMPTMLVLVRDITLEHQQTEDLRGFAASAAHDLKAPLTGLTGWLELAVDQINSMPDNKSALSALQRVERSTKALSAVIDDWLAYSLERRGSLAPEQVDLAELVARILPTFLVDTGNGLPTISTSLDDQVIADESLIRQVLANLISNSCKYAKPGKPAVISISSTALDGDWVRVEVSDQGRGIPESDLKDIFVPFQ
ncbi:MAG TPA: ATP-binding protein, partial [Marmoricola sp.]|nr:ATP-binding protein [Marmoricola sp.]